MPLDPTKIHSLILAHATGHESEDNCEFCQFAQKLALDEKFLKCSIVTANVMALTAKSIEDFYLDIFLSGFIVGVKLERTRVMEEEFRL